MFKQLKIYYFFISLPFALLLIGATVFFDGIKATITRNPHPQINYTIFVIIVVGGILILLNARRLVREARTMVEYFGAVHANLTLATLKQMANRYIGETACLLQMLAASGGRAISHQEQVAIENELANSRASLLRRNALPQYLTGLLVGMGLLGTFIGLLATLNDISTLISSFAEIDMQNASPLVVFRTMIERMKAPMQSMGIAFSASMFGLLGSIVLGLMMVGIRRLQGDMFSKLSSEVARHIELALSHESAAFAEFHAGDQAQAGPVSGDVAKVLIRIEERYAEAARSQQRTLTAVLDDLQKQRADMLRVLAEQSDANNNLRSEFQQLGRQLGNIFNVMEKSGQDLSTQVSDLTVQVAGDAKESHKLLAQQAEEQKHLRAFLIESHPGERLDEAVRTQQRILSSISEDLQQQRTDMQRALSDLNQSSHQVRSELQQLGGHMGAISNVMEQGKAEITTQISELTVHVGADAKEAQILLGKAGSEVRNELQQLGTQLGDSLDNVRQGQAEVVAKISELMTGMVVESKQIHEEVQAASRDMISELQNLASGLGTISHLTGQGNDALCSQISELVAHMAGKGAEAGSQDLASIEAQENQ